MPERRPLPELQLEIAAHEQLVYQLIGAAGQGGGGSHGARLLDRPAPERMIVEFTTRLLGREVKTIEEVSLLDGGRIHYRLLEGPLPAVEEEFSIQPQAGGCVLRYSGWFKAHRGWLRGRLESVLVPWLYRRAVWSSMLEIKALAEARQAKSRLFRLTD